MKVDSDYYRFCFVEQIQDLDFCLVLYNLKN